MHRLHVACFPLCACVFSAYRSSTGYEPSHSPPTHPHRSSATAMSPEPSALQLARFAGQNWSIWKMKHRRCIRGQGALVRRRVPHRGDGGRGARAASVRLGPDAEDEYEEIIVMFEGPVSARRLRAARRPKRARRRRRRPR